MMNRALLVIATLLLGGCTAGDGGTDPAAYYLQLEQTAAEAALAPAPGSPEEAQALARIRDYFDELTVESVRNSTHEVYADAAWFNDTLKTLQGAAAIRDYLQETAERDVEVRVRFEDVARSGPDWYLRWHMSVRSDALNEGKALESTGMTHMRLDRQGRILLHQDYWDSGSGLFAHLPVIGWSIGKVRDSL